MYVCVHVTVCVLVYIQIHMHMCKCSCMYVHIYVEARGHFLVLFLKHCPPYIFEIYLSLVWDPTKKKLQWVTSEP